MKLIRYSCCVLFLLFCFCYLYFMQGELLAHAQYVFSHGVTHYSILIGAIIITLVLQGLQWVVARITRLPSRFYALSYFPSLLALAALTDLSRQHISDATFDPWTWLAPLLLILFICVVLLIKRVASAFPNNDASLSAVLWPNYLLLFAQMLFCGISNSADDVFLYELKTERLILEGRYAEAAEVGIRAEATSPRLNNLRQFALSRMGEGELPERLFLYPQPYGVAGLLVLSDTAKSQERFTLTDLTARLGAHTEAVNMPVEDFIRQALRLQTSHLDSLLAVDSLTLATATDSLRHQHRGAVATLRRQVRTMADYHLCALLLEKNLPQFMDELPTYYPQMYDSLDAVRATLPLAYRQAIAIVAPQYSDDATLTLRENYVNMLDTLPATGNSRRNLSLYELGRSYWWYYDFQK
jgi:hypothetical protein